jgi:hypothetical protein
MPDALNPLKPWEHAKASALILYTRLQGGGNWGALWTSPWGTYGTLKYAYGTFINPRPAPTGSLEVSLSESDAQAFAVYGTVRVSGTNAIPPC